MEELGEWVMEKFGWEAKDAFLGEFQVMFFVMQA